MDQPRALTRSIVWNVTAFGLLHSVIFVLLSIAYAMDPVYALWFFVAELAVLTLLTWVLFKSRKDFVFVESGETLRKVNLANQLTMFRITSLPSLLLLLIAARSYPVAVFLIVYTVLAFISDMLDGYVSRRFKQGTKIGGYLDSMSDYAVLLAVSIAFVQFSLIPLWFFIAIIVRFVVQWALMYVIYLIQRFVINARSSWLGKASVFGTMVVFGVALLQLFPWFDPYRFIVFWIEIAASLILLVSLVEKIVLFVKDLKPAFELRDKGSQPGVAATEGVTVTRNGDTKNPKS